MKDFRSFTAAGFFENVLAVAASGEGNALAIDGPTDPDGAVTALVATATLTVVVEVDPGLVVLGADAVVPELALVEGGGDGTEDDDSGDNRWDDHVCSSLLVVVFRLGNHPAIPRQYPWALLGGAGQLRLKLTEPSSAPWA